MNLEDRIKALEARVEKLEGGRQRGRPGRIPIPAAGDLDAATARVAQIMAGAERRGSSWWVAFGHENPDLRRQVQEWLRGVKAQSESPAEALRSKSNRR